MASTADCTLMCQNGGTLGDGMMDGSGIPLVVDSCRCSCPFPFGGPDCGSECSVCCADHWSSDCMSTAKGKSYLWCTLTLLKLVELQTRSVCSCLDVDCYAIVLCTVLVTCSSLKLSQK